MSYNDPYYTHSQYPAQQYQDAPFDPYEVQQQQQQQQTNREYEQPVYEPYGQDPADRSKEGVRSGFEGDDVIPPPMGEKTPSNMRRWRAEHNGNLWNKGSRAGCFGRFFCCTILIFLFFVISVVLSLALWLRPPNIIVGQPTPDLSTFAINGESISIALPINVSVNNPNYFSVELATLDATVLYPINNTQVGSGHMTKIEFKDHTQTNFTFPVTIQYNASSDPSGAVITDLAKHCGIDPSVAASDISVTVNIKLGLKIFFISFSTTISEKASFACPLGSNAQELEDLLKSLGININDIGALAGLLH